MPAPASPRLRRALLLPLLCLAAACRGEGKDPDTVRRIPLPGGVSASASLALVGRWAWIADGGWLAALDTAEGRIVSRTRYGSGPARIVGIDAEAVYLRTAGGVVAVDPGAAGVRARRKGVGEDAFAVDPLRPQAYVLGRSGGVVGITSGMLRPRWGWPERGAPGTGVATSPLGDRVYLALGGDEPRVLTLDAETGRVLGEAELPGVARALVAGGDGMLFAVLAERAGVLALRPGPRGLEESWRASVRGLGDSLRVVGSPVGERMAIVSRDVGRAHVLDTRTGAVLRTVRQGAVDAFFSAHGALYLLERGGIRVVRGD